MSVKTEKWLLLNEDGKPIGLRKVAITRDFVSYSVDHGDYQDWWLVEPISEEEYQLRNDGA